MPGANFDELLAGVSVYQDVVVKRRVIRPGVCDCGARWRLIAPSLAGAKTLLDVGSNFGWFGQRFCEQEPRGVVCSMEADPRSATVQRAVLEANRRFRMALLVWPARRRLLARWRKRGQRYDAALCLNVLHWMRDGVGFLATLGKIADRIVIELPHPEEDDAGHARARRKLGRADELLARLFPAAPRRMLGEVPSHLRPELKRELWLVEPGADRPPPSLDGIPVRSLLEAGLSWPPSSWWRKQLIMPCDEAPGGVTVSAGPLFTADGLLDSDQLSGSELSYWLHRFDRLPETGIAAEPWSLSRSCRRLVARLW